MSNECEESIIKEACTMGQIHAMSRIKVHVEFELSNALKQAEIQAFETRKSLISDAEKKYVALMQSYEHKVDHKCLKRASDEEVSAWCKGVFEGYLQQPECKCNCKRNMKKKGLISMRTDGEGLITSPKMSECKAPVKVKSLFDPIEIDTEIIEEPLIIPHIPGKCKLHTKSRQTCAECFALFVQDPWNYACPSGYCTIHLKRKNRCSCRRK